MGFKYVLIKVEDEPNGLSLVAEYQKLINLYEKNPEADHGHTIVAQIFASKDGPPYYFLSGSVLNREESKAFAEILAKRRPPNMTDNHS